MLERKMPPVVNSVFVRVQKEDILTSSAVVFFVNANQGRKGREENERGDTRN